MMRKVYLYLLLLHFAIPFVQGQQKLTASQVLDKAIEVNKAKTYISYNSNYALYKDYKTTSPYETYDGVVLRKNGVNYLRIKNTEFVTFNDYGLKINHDQKAVVMEKGNSNIKELPTSVESYTKGFKSKLLPSDGQYYICELNPPKISQIMLHKVVLHIKKSDFSVAKQVLYLVEKMEVKNKSGLTEYSVPRLEISFKKREKNETKDNVLTLKANYFTQKAGQITLSKKLSKYKLFKS